MEPRPRRDFVLVRTPANLAVDRAVEFSLQGLTRYDGRYSLQAGDRAAIYVTAPLSSFVATIEITGSSYEDDEPVWVKPSNGETYPIRIASRPRIVVADTQAVHGRELVSKLEIARYLRDEARWGMLFRNAIREVPENDFELIEKALEQQLGD